MERCRTFILWLFRPALRPLKLPSQICVPGRSRTRSLSIISRMLFQPSHENICMEAGNQLLLPWRHGVSPAPVGFHHYILLASMAQQRGLEPLSQRGSPTTRFPGGPTTSYRTAANLPAELFSHSFITADRTESRDSRGARYGCSCGEEGGTRTLTSVYRMARLAVGSLTIGLTPSK